MAGRLGRDVYRSRAWRRLRLAKLRSVNWRCEKCGVWTREVHHVVSLESGGDPFPPLSGLQALCASCHTERHRPAFRERRRWRDMFARVLREEENDAP